MADRSTSRRSWVLASLICLVGGGLSARAAYGFTSQFGWPHAGWTATANAYAAATITLPLACLAAAVLPWLLKVRRRAWLLFLLPLMQIATVAASIATTMPVA